VTIFSDKLEVILFVIYYKDEDACPLC